MRQSIVALATLTLICTLTAEPHYFHQAVIISAEEGRAGQVYVIDSPLGIITVRGKNRKQAFRTGPVRISMEPKARVGDSVYLLDERDREYRAIILERKSHPPPPAITTSDAKPRR